MTALDKKIALRMHTLALRQQSMRLQKTALHTGALGYCRQPSTLICAALSGFVLARLFPAENVVRHQEQQTTKPLPFIQGQITKLLPLLLFQYVNNMFKQPPVTHTHTE